MIRRLLAASIIIVGCTVPYSTRVSASILQNSAEVDLVQQSDSSPSFLIADDTDRNYKSGKNERHGRSHELPSLKRQLAEIREHKNQATTRRDKVKLRQKEKNIEEAIRKAEKGDSDSIREKGQQRFEVVLPELADTP